MKDLTEIGLCYYPTTTVLIDDDKDFLTILSAQLFSKDHLACRPFSNPIEALHYLNDQYHPDFFIHHCFKSDDNNNVTTNHSVNLNLSEIHKEIYNPDRFAQIVDVVVDFDMPKLTGAEFCQQVKNPLIQKIMLTGKAGNDLAVNLFNEGKINQFMMKTGSTELITQVPKVILNMRHKTFMSFSEKALSHNDHIMTHPLKSVLTDVSFINLFNDFYQKSQAIEHYILDNQGSFLFLDKNGKLSWLIVVSEAEMERYMQIAQSGEGTSSVVNALKNRSHIPFFPVEASQNQTSNDNCHKDTPSHWNKYLHPARVLDGKTRYYYHYLSDLKTSNIKFDKIISYQSYLDDFSQKYFEDL